MANGKFITIEGTEGAGKSTALQFIKKHLQAKKITTVWTREPGGTEIAEEIRELLLHPKSQETITPEAEILLMFAARAQHLQKLILPALTENKWVVCDRFIDATYAYQGGGRGIGIDWIATLDNLVVSDVYPDLTLLLDIDPDIGFERTKRRHTERDRIEQEKMEFFVQVREAYLDRANQNPQRIKIIDASLPIHLVERQIGSVLDEFIARQR